MPNLHTPGPWRALPWTEDRSLSYVVGPKGETIATVSQVRDQGVSNQQLLAAAPDLLAALEGFIDEDCYCIEGVAHKCIYCVGHAAIAKAKGQTV
jgi:hypothetical protein